jgi:hypothetical protein
VIIAILCHWAIKLDVIPRERREFFNSLLRDHRLIDKFHQMESVDPSTFDPSKHPNILVTVRRLIDRYVYGGGVFKLKPVEGIPKDAFINAVLDLPSDAGDDQAIAEMGNNVCAYYFSKYLGGT